MFASTGTILSDTITNPQVTSAFHGLLVSTLETILVFVATLIGMLVKSYLNAANSTWKQKISYRLVCFAEQKIGDNAEKQAYVASQIHQLLPKVSEDEAAHLIEEAVVQLKSVQAGAVTTNQMTVPSGPSQG